LWITKVCSAGSSFVGVVCEYAVSVQDTTKIQANDFTIGLLQVVTPVRQCGTK
jgi:hypothetical protein